MNRPRCPICGEELALMVVPKKGRHFHCTCVDSAGDSVEDLEPPSCHICDGPMQITLGKYGSWQGRWFWSCPVHVVPNAALKEPQGPADPGTLHNRHPKLGGGYSRHGI